MSTIRPLATVAILAALGVFLAMKIQQQPVASTAQLTGDWDDAPAFSAETGSSAAGGEGIEGPAFGEAPTFGGESSASIAPPSFPKASFPEPPAPAPTATPPALPPLPTLPTSDPTTATSTPPTTGPTAVDPNSMNLPDLPLPENIPQASYPGEPSADEGTTSGRVPSLGTATPDMASPDAPPASEPWSPPAAAAPTADLPTPPAAASAYQPATSPYGSYDPSALDSAPADKPTSDNAGLSFSEARPAIQAALDRNELPRAHRLLSQWYGDPNLSSEERSEVDRLLGQLAGTVIYSNQHLLKPAHQVQPGETLETIAKQHGTTWQLLGKINGVAKSDAVEPGKILKVVPGPFSAVVDLSESEVVLSVDGLYAGRFPALVEGAVEEGAWQVVSKDVKYQPGAPVADAQGYTKSLSLDSGAGAAKVELGAMGDEAATGQPKISVAARDLGDLFDILSEGSEVTIRR